ncbi:antirestriction protein [Salmonella enterica subsp. enterica serovar Bietri]|nr:antirestriction protein [Salmonella enterica subsp. enterica serovar Bietri]
MTATMSLTPAPFPANTPNSPEAITVTTLPDEQRINFWPRYFGNVRQWVFLEPQVFSWLDLWSADYQGGVWEFHTLSNCGAFLTPPDCDHYHLFNESNGNEAILSTEATGIAVCLMAWSHHACRTHCESMSEHYYRLRDYALSHPESRFIMHLID